MNSAPFSFSYQNLYVSAKLIIKQMPLEPSFSSTSALMTSYAELIICCGSGGRGKRLVHCRVFNSIPDLCTFSVVTTKNVLLHCQMSPIG